MRRTHIIKRVSEKTLCGQRDVMTDYFDGLANWVKGWTIERINSYLKVHGYCGHCIKKFLSELKKEVDT